MKHIKSVSRPRQLTAPIITDSLIDILLSMNINDVWDKNLIIKMLYPKFNYYTKRSFEVLLCRVKKRILHAKYKTNINNEIKRIL